MSKNQTKLIAIRRENFKDYLEIHSVFEGRSLQEVFINAACQPFLGITEHEIAFQSNCLLPLTWARQVSVTSAAPELSVEPDILPM